MRHDIASEQNRQDYLKGYDAKINEINSMGWDDARDKFNLDYSLGYKPINMGVYYYSQGEIDALVDKI